MEDFLAYTFIGVVVLVCSIVCLAVSSIPVLIAFALLKFILGGTYG